MADDLKMSSDSELSSGASSPTPMEKDVPASDDLDRALLEQLEKDEPIEPVKEPEVKVEETPIEKKPEVAPSPQSSDSEMEEQNSSFDLQKALQAKLPDKAPPPAGFVANEIKKEKNVESGSNATDNKDKASGESGSAAKDSTSNDNREAIGKSRDQLEQEEREKMQ
jgi:hypothetical protein